MNGRNGRNGSVVLRSPSLVGVGTPEQCIHLPGPHRWDLDLQRVGQALTDLIARDANLPPEKRLYPGEVSPESLPVWGSIIDDVWALDHVDDGGNFL